MTEQPEQKSDDEVWVRPFADVLLDLSRGQVHADASTKMQDLVAAVLETGKAGSLQLTLKVSKSKSDTPMVEITDTLKVSMPRIDRGASIFYVTDDHRLTREDPHQLHLPLREVPTSTDTNTTEQKLREAH